MSFPSRLTIAASTGLLAGAALLFVGCGDGTGSEASLDGRIVATALRGPATDLATANADGSSLQLLAGTGRDEQPTWSSDGRRIAFLRTFGSQQPDVFVRDWPSGETRRVTNTATVAEGRPRWSPDGSRLMFVGAGGILTANVDGTGLDTVVVGLEPAWAADGRVAFVRPPSAPAGAPQGIVILADARDSTSVVGTFEGIGFRTPDWSTDGRRLAAIQRTFPAGSHARTSLVVMRSGSAPQAILTDTADIEHPAWAPDGEHLVVTRRTSAGLALWVLAEDGSGLRRITPRAPNATEVYGHTHASWTSDAP